MAASHLHGLVASTAGPGDSKTSKPVCPGAGRLQMESLDMTAESLTDIDGDVLETDEMPAPAPMAAPGP